MSLDADRPRRSLSASWRSTAVSWPDAVAGAPATKAADASSAVPPRFKYRMYNAVPSTLACRLNDTLQHMVKL
jgi:hypothetical protein